MVGAEALPDDFDWRTQTLKVGTVSRIGQWVRGTCADCSVEDVLLYDAPLIETRLVCNDCVRKYPVDTRQPCDKCGAKGNVWRDPLSPGSEFLCDRCHDPEKMFRNRWGSVDSSPPSRVIGMRKAVCELAQYNPGTCRGEIRWDSARGYTACNFHRGRKSANEANN